MRGTFESGWKNKILFKLIVTPTLLGLAAGCAPKLRGGSSSGADALTADTSGGAGGTSNSGPFSLTGVNPSSPSNTSNTPMIRANVSDTQITQVKLYSDSSCTTQIGSGPSSSFASPGIQVTVALNSSTPIYVKGEDSSGNPGACTYLTQYTHDSVAPTLSLSSPSGGSTINASAVSSVTFSGSCSENGALVRISGAKTASASCSAGSWSVSLNLSSLADGSLNFLLDLSDAAGNAAPQQSLTLTKNTLAPTANSITIAGGATYTTSTSVSLALASTGATEMYVTNTAGCSSGGSWEPYSASKAWTLSQTNATATAYVKYRNTVGNESACVNDSIIHDSVAPTVAISAPSASQVDSTGSITYTVTYTGASAVTLAAADITLNTTGGASCSKAVSGSGTSTRTVTLSSCSGVGGTVGISIASGTAQDAAGNSAGAAGPSSTLSVVADAPTKLALSGPASVTAGSCSSAYTVTSQDSSSSPAAVASNTTITLSGGGSGGFYSDSSCNTAISGSKLTMASGTSQVTFYFKDSAAESLTLSAAATGLTSGTRGVTVSAASTATKLAWSGPGSVTTRGCSSAYTIIAQDGNGSAQNVSSATTVSLSAGGAADFYSDSSCSTRITSVQIASGSSASPSFYLKDDLAESLLFTAAASGLSTGYKFVDTTGSSPVKLALTGPSAAGDNACTAITVSARDAYNQLAAVGSNTTVTLGGNGLGTYYSDSSCSSSVTTVSLPSGTSSTTVYYRDRFVETVLLTASASGFGSGGLSLNITQSSSRKLLLANTGGAQTTGACISYTVTHADTSNNPVSVGASSLTVSLAGGGNGFFYSGSSCTGGSEITSISIAASTSSATFYFKDATAEVTRLLATAYSKTGGTLSVTVGSPAGTATQLALSGSAAPSLDACVAYTVSSLSSAGAAATVSSATTVNLAGQGSGAFYSDAGCSSQVTSLIISSGSSSGAFYFKTSVPESSVFTASATGLSSGLLKVTISNSRSAVRLALSGMADVSLGRCYAFTVTSLDSGGYPTPVSSGTTITLSGAGSGAFYSDDACTSSITSLTLPISTSAKTFYFMSMAEESLSFVATDNSSALAAGKLNILVSNPRVIAAGWASTCAIVNGGAQCWGDNAYGQLGNNSNLNSKVPVYVSGLSSGVTAVTTFNYHSCAIVNGAAKCWGHNDSGQLGDNSTTDSWVPVQVSGLTSGVTAISAGAYHTCAVFSGAAHCWGYNAEGELGDNSTTDSWVPVQVSGLTSGVSTVAAGEFHTCAVVQGAAQCWGFSSGGLLGDGTGNDSSVPVQVSGLISGVTAIDAGSSDTCAIVNGAAWCWGGNYSGELGDGTYTVSNIPVQVTGLSSGVTHIAMGADHACAVVNGSAKCWGDNSYGQLGDGTQNISLTPVQVSGLTSRVIAIDAGWSHTCAVGGGGPVCWGDNSGGMLGNSSIPLEYSPDPVLISGLAANVTAVSTGTYHNCAIVNGAAQCWGRNSSGQLGNSSTADSPTPVQVTGLTASVTAIAAGDSHSCAVVAGAAKCWGDNSYGKLGNNSTVASSTPVQVSSLTSGVTAITTGLSHGCAIVSGAAKCWGLNSSGKLGNNSTTDSWVPVQVSGLTINVTAISAGFGNSCAVVNGAAQCWGSNGNGQLGNNSTASSKVPVQVVGLTSGATAIAAGYSHSCAVVSGAAKCWGANGSGQLGNGSTNQSLVPVQVSSLTSGVVAVAVGVEFSCALKSDNRMYCWGSNSWSQLGNGLTTNSGAPVLVQGLSASAMFSSAGYSGNGNQHSCAVTTGGAVYCWGKSDYGVLGFDAGFPGSLVPIAPEIL